MSRVDEYHTNLFKAQEHAVRIENEGLSEEQIQARCLELKNYIIEKESMNNRFKNPALHKLWNSPPRIKRNF